MGLQAREFKRVKVSLAWAGKDNLKFYDLSFNMGPATLYVLNKSMFSAWSCNGILLGSIIIITFLLTWGILTYNLLWTIEICSDSESLIPIPIPGLKSLIPVQIPIPLYTSVSARQLPFVWCSLSDDCKMPARWLTRHLPTLTRHLSDKTHKYHIHARHIPYVWQIYGGCLVYVWCTSGVHMV